MHAVIVPRRSYLTDCVLSVKLINSFKLWPGRGNDANKVGVRYNRPGKYTVTYMYSDQADYTDHRSPYGAEVNVG